MLILGEVAILKLDERLARRKTRVAEYSSLGDSVEEVGWMSEMEARR